jgi:hypothetical protein
VGFCRIEKRRGLGWNIAACDRGFKLFSNPIALPKKSDFHVKKIHFTEFMNGVENCSLTCGSKLRESLLTGQGNDPP